MGSVTSESSAIPLEGPISLASALGSILLSLNVDETQSPQTGG
jgi:hypothetical protein